MEDREVRPLRRTRPLPCLSADAVLASRFPRPGGRLCSQGPRPPPHTGTFGRSLR